MRLTDASVAIRPRNPWEAIDLGVLLARGHRMLLMSSWAIVTLPIFALLCVVFQDYPTIAMLVFWWLKPAFERLPLLILSQALFGSTPSLEQALRSWLQVLKPQLLASLTWRRLSLSRSFKLPVQQLEGLSGTARQQRIVILSQRNLSAARWLTAVGSWLEITLWIGLSSAFYLLIPQQVQLDWSWASLIDVQGNWNWLEHLGNFFYALVLIFWEPIYVACGFTLYLNRRTELEAWDIELVLRRLRQRLIGSAYVLLIGIGLAFIPFTPSAWAVNQSYSCPLPPLDSPAPARPLVGPDSPRLTHQALTSSAARESIKAQLAKPPFKNPETISGWRLAENKSAHREEKLANTALWLLRLISGLTRIASLFAHVIEGVLWAGIAVMIGVLIWRYRAWVSAFVSRRQRPSTVRRSVPKQLFGLQVNVESLPEDIASAVEQLWATQPREALGLLYRALLNRLLVDYQLPLKNADTEGQVLQQVAQLELLRLSEFSERVTTHWQNLAYGHRLPAAHLKQELCGDWRQLFGSGTKP